MKDRKGFTIVELLIAIAIIGVIATIGSFSWNRYTLNASLKSAARDVASDIFVTRGKAVSESVNYRVIFNVAANNYSIAQGTAAGGPYVVTATKSPASAATQVADVVLVSANFGLGGSTADVQARGIVAAGSVQLRNSRNSTATLTVNITGRTYVQFAMQ